MTSTICRRFVSSTFWNIRIFKSTSKLICRMRFGAGVDDLPFHGRVSKARRSKDLVVNCAFLRYDPIVRRDALAFSIRVGNIGDHNHSGPLACHRPWWGFTVRNGKCGRCRKICWGKGKLVSAACGEPISEYLPPSRARRAFLANQSECGVNCANESLEVFFPVPAGKVVCGQRGVDHLRFDSVSEKVII